MIGQPTNGPCDDCGKDKHTWADERFGCMRERLPRFQFRHGMKGDMQDYHAELARKPSEYKLDPRWKPGMGDPEAYTSGPKSVKKLLDKRLRQGWQRVERQENTRPEKVSGEQMVRQAYERAKAKGFRLDSELED